MVGMLSVFVSSLQRDYSAVRGAVRRAVEILHMRPLMAEFVGARPESPQRALLDLLAEADVFLLIIGARYSGPTEDEFNEARRLGRPIVVLRQRVDLAEEQQAFLERVAVGWVGGRMWAEFDDEHDVLEVAVEALSYLGQDRRLAQFGSAAQERAATLAVGERRQGFGSRRRRHGLRWCRLSPPLSSMRSTSSTSWATPSPHSRAPLGLFPRASASTRTYVVKACLWRARKVATPVPMASPRLGPMGRLRSRSMWGVEERLLARASTPGYLPAASRTSDHSLSRFGRRSTDVRKCSRWRLRWRSLTRSTRCSISQPTRTRTGWGCGCPTRSSSRSRRPSCAAARL